MPEHNAHSPDKPRTEGAETNYFIFGQGRISGYLSCALGLLSLLAVACFHFPEYLTTPELRAKYDVGLLRNLLAGAMVASVAFDTLTFFLTRCRSLGFAGIVLTLIAQAAGGASVEVAEFNTPRFSFGLDWLVLDLLGSTAIFVFLEKLFPHRKEQAILRPLWRLDLRFFIVNHLLISGFLLAANTIAHKSFGWAVYEPLRQTVGAWPVWAQFCAALVAADLAQYWTHYAYHRVPFLWNFHAVHHSVEHMDWLAGSRLHLAEIVVTRVSVLVPLFLLGVGEAALSAYVVVVGFQAVMNHANVNIPFGPLKYLFVTPQFHHWHHSADKEAIDMNFAAHLPVLDMVFRTYLPQHDRWPEKYGVVGKPLPVGYLRQQIYPFTNPKKDEKKEAA